MGRINQRIGRDTEAKVVFAELNDRKLNRPQTNCSKIGLIACLAEHGLRTDRALADRATAFRCAHRRHEEELHSALDGAEAATNHLDHTLTNPQTAQPSGVGKRFHDTVLDRFHHRAFHEKNYRPIEEPRANREECMAPGAMTRRAAIRAAAASAARRCNGSLSAALAHATSRTATRPGIRGA